jgi:hypothetical protein
MNGKTSKELASLLASVAFVTPTVWHNSAPTVYIMFHSYIEYCVFREFCRVTARWVSSSLSPSITWCGHGITTVPVPSCNQTSCYVHHALWKCSFTVQGTGVFCLWFKLWLFCQCLNIVISRGLDTVTLFRMLFVTFISLIFLTPDVCNSDVKGFPVFERSSYVLFTKAYVESKLLCHNWD